MMDKSKKEEDKIREEFTELLDMYYSGSFPQMVCEK